MQRVIYVRGEYGGTRTLEGRTGIQIATFNTSDYAGCLMFDAAIATLSEGTDCAIYDSTHGHAIYTPAWAVHMFLPSKPQPDAAMAAEIARAGEWSVASCAMSAENKPIEAGDWVESTSTNPDDYDDGAVREVLDATTILVAWRSGVVTPCPSSKVVHA